MLESEKRTKLGACTTVNMKTGKVINVKPNAMTLQRPSPTVCQECATGHAFDQPHNQQSLHYQMRFHAEYARWPTWTDAMAHCPESVRKAWRSHLVQFLGKNGKPVPQDLLDTTPNPET